MRYMIMVMAVFLFGCASNAKTETTKNQQKTSIVEQVKHQAELIVVLCHSNDYAKAQLIWQQEHLTLKKRVSPTMLTLLWADDRDAHQVMQSLAKYDVFRCGMEVNQKYSIKKVQGKLL